MLTHVIAPQRFFLQVPHEIVRHPRLGSDAKALLIYGLSLPRGAAGSLRRWADQVRLKSAAFTRAKRQLLDEGYLHEWREQGDGGRWATVQLVTNVPLSREEAERARRDAAAGRPPDPASPPVPPSTAKPVVGRPGSRRDGCSLKKNVGNIPKPTGPATAAAEPGGEDVDGELVRQGAAVLASLGVRLGEGDVDALAPLAARWLARDPSPERLRRALTDALPGFVFSPAGFVKRRLVRTMPVRPPAPVRHEPLAECGECRAPLPRGMREVLCRGCSAGDGAAGEPPLRGPAAARAGLRAGLALVGRGVGEG